MANLDITNDSIGGGYGLGQGGGMTWLVALVVLWILFKDGFGHNDRKGHEGYGACGIHGTRSAFYDESNFEEERNLNNKIDCQEEKTRALICAKFDKQDDREYAKMSAEIAALKAEKYSDARFDRIERELCQVAKTAPCFVESAPVSLQRCGEPRRCDRD